MRKFPVILTALYALAFAAGCAPSSNVDTARWCPDDLSQEQCRDVLVARAANQIETAAQVYLADSEFRRGYMQAMRDSATWPQPVGGSR